MAFSAGGLAPLDDEPQHERHVSEGGAGSAGKHLVIAYTLLVKVMGLRFCCSNGDRLDAGSLDGNGVILILQDTIRRKETFLG